MEMLDIIDGNDRVIGCASKEECHASGLLHRSVFVFLFDGAGRLVLQKRSAKKDVRPNKVTASACGHVLRGESYEAAARRELLEELGAVTDLVPVLRTFGPYPEDRELIALFEGTFAGDLEPNTKEIAELLALHVDEVKAEMEKGLIDFGKTFRKVFCEYCACREGRAQVE